MHLKATATESNDRSSIDFKLVNEVVVKPTKQYKQECYQMIA